MTDSQRIDALERGQAILVANVYALAESVNALGTALEHLGIVVRSMAIAAEQLPGEQTMCERHTRAN